MSEEDKPHAELGEQDRSAVPEDEIEEVDEAHDEERHEEARAETAAANAADEMPNDDR